MVKTIITINIPYKSGLKQFCTNILTEIVFFENNKKLIKIVSSATTEAIVAPNDLKYGINNKFNKKLTIAPIITPVLYKFCLFCATRN